MKTPTTIKRRRNPNLARLDRMLAKHGEAMELVKTIGTSPQIKTRFAVRGIVRTFGEEQLIGAISQTNHLVIISPEDLRRAKFPGGLGPATVASGNIPTGHNPPRDFGIPPLPMRFSFAARRRPSAVSRRSMMPARSCGSSFAFSADGTNP